MAEELRDLRQALIDDIEQIEDNAALFRDGRNSAYQAVAIQLRNLLIGGRRALVGRVLPGATFHKLKEPSHHELPERVKEGLAEAEKRGAVRHDFLFEARGSLKLSTGGPSQLELEFQTEAAPIAISDWLSQWVISPDVPMDKLIMQLASEEVAHTQRNRGKTIQRADKFTILRGGKVDRHLPQMAVVAIGEYVAGRLRNLLSEDSDSREDH